MAVHKVLRETPPGGPPLSFGAQHLKILAMVFVIVLTALSIARLVRVSGRGGNAWITGDWLIHYADGYVRRGLLGEVAWVTASALSVELIWVITALQIGSFAALTVFSVLLFITGPPRLSTTLFFISPAFLAFHFWDFPGSFRKEIFVLAIFSGLLWWSTRNLHHSVTRFLFLASWAVAPAVFGFVHEAMVFYAPLMLVALWLVGARISLSPSSLWATTIVGGILSSVPLGLSLLYPGGVEEKEAICMSVVSTGLNPAVCGGAIGAIGWPLDEAVQVVVENATPLYLVLAAFALAPAILLTPHTRVVVAVGFATTALIPIFVVGADWGRWIHIFAAIVSLTLFRLASTGEIERLRPRLTIGPSTLIVAIYGLAWHIPHFAASYWGPGFVNVLRSVVGGAGLG